MSNPILSLFILSIVGSVCANTALLSLKIRERFGFPDHQVLKRRRLPSDATSRGGPFYILFGAIVGSCAAISHGLHLTSFLLIASSCTLGGLIISKKRVLKLGEAYLKRAYENVHAKEYAATIQDANEASRCGYRYHEEAQDLVRATKELRQSEQASRQVQLATAASDPSEERRNRSRARAW